MISARGVNGKVLVIPLADKYYQSSFYDSRFVREISSPAPDELEPRGLVAL